MWSASPGRACPRVNIDLCDAAAVDELFRAHPGIEAVIDFAVHTRRWAKSVAKPLEYYSNNLISALNVLNAMKKYGVKNFVFSSSATVFSATRPACPSAKDFPGGRQLPTPTAPPR